MTSGATGAVRGQGGLSTQGWRVTGSEGAQQSLLSTACSPSTHFLPSTQLDTQGQTGPHPGQRGHQHPPPRSSGHALAEGRPLVHPGLAFTGAPGERKPRQGSGKAVEVVCSPLSWHQTAPPGPRAGKVMLSGSWGPELKGKGFLAPRGCCAPVLPALVLLCTPITARDASTAPS